jgi:hypothetical protein
LLQVSNPDSKRRWRFSQIFALGWLRIFHELKGM